MYINNKNINIKRFSSNEMKLLYNDLIPLALNNTVDIIYDNSISIFEIMILCKFYKDNNINVNLYLSYLPYQRMDHDNKKEAYTLKYVAEIFNDLNLDNLIICEPHCKLDLFNNAKALNIVEKIFNKVKKEIGFGDSDYLIFTDKGSKEKYGNLSKNHIYFKKNRDKNTGLICSHEMIGELPKKAKAIIIDDIISSGDTMISTINLLPKDIELYVISAHFEDNKYNHRLFKNKKIKQIYSSNSLRKEETKKLKLFDIKELIND